MGQIFAVRSSVKRKQENFHPRVTASLHQPQHGRRQKSQILCDHVPLPKLLFHHLKDIIARTFLPMPELRCRITVGNGVILVKAPEMIDPQNIIQLITSGDPPHPPVIPCLLMVIPAVQRIPPKLPRSGKQIRRTARHTRRQQIFIQLEQLRPGPYVRRIIRHVDRNVPDDPDSLFVCIFFQRKPLFPEQKLLEPDKADLPCILFPIAPHGFGPSEPDILIPLAETLSAKGIFDCHIQCIIIQPAGIFLTKPAKRRIVFDIAVLICLSEDHKPGFINLSVIHISLLPQGDFSRIFPFSGDYPPRRFPLTALLPRRIFRRSSLAVLSCDPARFHQLFQIDKIRISRIGGKRLIG